MAKRASLAGSLVDQPWQAAPPTPEDEKRKGQTLRLSPEAWFQLKILALQEHKTAHALLLEAVNDLFVKNGKPPIA